MREQSPVTLSEVIYWTEKDLEDHVPILRNQKHLVPGVHNWGRISKVIEDPASWGWQIFADDDEEEQYQVYGKIAVRCHGANVEFAWKLCKGTEWMKLDGKTSSQTNASKFEDSSRL